MPHVSARTVSVMVLQGTCCVSLSKQFPPTSVICPSVYFSVCLVTSLSVSVCLYRSVPTGHTLTHRHKLTNVLWPLCAYACWREQTLPHLISAGRWEIPFISSRFPSMPLVSLPLLVCCSAGKSCKLRKTLLAFLLAADQAVCFQFLILVRSFAAADWARQDRGRVWNVTVIRSHSGAALLLCELAMNSLLLYSVHKI